MVNTYSNHLVLEVEEKCNGIQYYSRSNTPTYEALMRSSTLMYDPHSQSNH